VIGDTADIFETESDGKRTFLIVTNQALSNSDTVLKHLHSVLKQCEGVAQTSTKTHAIKLDSAQQSEAGESHQRTAESFNINTQLVSCAASSGHYACACPGSVAAYHGALSRLRLGFKSRLGRFFFASIW
jgi:hypothetical protein